MKMIEVSDLVTFECPHCGFIQKGRKGSEPECPKCTPAFHGWVLRFSEKGPFFEEAAVTLEKRVQEYFDSRNRE